MKDIVRMTILQITIFEKRFYNTLWHEFKMKYFQFRYIFVVSKHSVDLHHLSLIYMLSQQNSFSSNEILRMHYLLLPSFC